MMLNYDLRITGKQFESCYHHLLDDGKEAVSLLFCTPVFRDGRVILLVKEIRNIPHSACVRASDYVSWPTEEFLLPEIERIERNGLSLIILHSHPTGFPEFSSLDDKGDKDLIGRLNCNIEGDQPHGSAILLPDGSLKARILLPSGSFVPIMKITVCGDEIKFLTDSTYRLSEFRDFHQKNSQVYGLATTQLLSRLRVGIVGCSGTGSPLIELMLRHNVGELVLVDPDKIESGNLNRMILSRVKDVESGVFKVDRYKAWQIEAGLPTNVVPIKEAIPSPYSCQELSSCDVIFGCLDNVAARHYLNKLATAYLIPYFDLGVALRTRSQNDGMISHAVARCHYLQPDRACLLDREAFSAKRLADENFARDDPEFYARLKAAGYTGVVNDVQAVMTLTMEAACLGMDDFLARIHSYRLDGNGSFDQQDRSFTQGSYEHFSHSDLNVSLKSFLAVGDAIESL